MIFMKYGFTSTSLRGCSIEEVTAAALKCGAQGIEWGTDVHIRTQEDALKAKELCDGYCIEIRSLGSYYRIGTGDMAEWERLCCLASVMGAKYIRTWLGTEGSADTTVKKYRELVSETLEMADIADRYGVIISNECHPNTFNDDTSFSLKYLEACRYRAKTYYQSWYRDRAGDFEKLDRLLPFTSDVHVSFSELIKFQKDCKKDPSFLPDIISALAGKRFGGYVFIEFTAEDKTENLVSDVFELKNLIEKAEMF